MNRKTRIWENIVILAIGVTLICLYSHPDLFRWIITLAGVMFLVPAVIGMIGQANHDKRMREEALRSGLRRRGRLNSVMSWITCIGGVLIGLVLILLYQKFQPVLSYVLGAFVAAGGLYHFYELAVGYREVTFHAWFYIFPLLLIAGGCVLIFVELDNPTTALITGIGMVVFAVASILEAYSARVATKRVAAADDEESDDYFVSDDNDYDEAETAIVKPKAPHTDYYVQDTDPE